ncbi:hypothetical protein FHS90_000531 [Rufibacter quisquiliarum]|uniref:Uncharacterized protein n=1 Tax=Rufibacter quisquiliarum TaxID=1549639 RepID=A0A839G8R1_9BACT|nr:hypothetical protein [Rufibacter quisquiliarum]
MSVEYCLKSRSGIRNGIFPFYGINAFSACFGQNGPKTGVCRREAKPYLWGLYKTVSKSTKTDSGGRPKKVALDL